MTLPGHSASHLEVHNSICPSRSYFFLFAVNLARLYRDLHALFLSTVPFVYSRGQVCGQNSDTLLFCGSLSYQVNRSIVLTLFYLKMSGS